MSYQIVVCIKQVPDTANISGDVMKEDGTVNRSVLPAIFNPEDLNALEMALEVKEKCGGHVTVVTMGPLSAAEVLRQSLYRGADRVALLSDRRFAASDTLATSFVLSRVVRKLAAPDLVFCGRQAIDGDTAQVGPQLAQKLGLLQFTYVEEITEISNGHLVVRRLLDTGYEIVRGPLPALLTVVGSANHPRPPAARKLMKFKKAETADVIAETAGEDEIQGYVDRGLIIERWTIDDIDCTPEQCGTPGSATHVKEIDTVKLVSLEHRNVEPTPEGLDGLMVELMSEHIIE